MSLATHLARLEASGLIRPAAVEPELEYIFRHALVQEAAYASVLRADRRILHRAVGEALEQLYAERREELSGVLAHHFAAAGERDKAVQYHRLAAQQAEARYAYEEALQHLRAALDVLSGEEHVEMRLTLLEELADDQLLLRYRVQAVSTYQTALDLAKALPDAGAQRVIAARLHGKILLGLVRIRQGSFEQFETMAGAAAASRAALESLLGLIESEPPQAEVVRTLTALASDAYWLRVPPDWEMAERYVRAAIDRAENLDAAEELSEALEVLASVQFSRGQLREHMQTSLRRLMLGRDPRFSDLRARVDTLTQAGDALVFVGEYAQAMPYYLEAESLADHLRWAGMQLHLLGQQSYCWLRLDRWEALSEIDEKCSALERRYPHEQIGPTCFNIGLNAAVRALRGEGERARILREEARAIMVAADGPTDKWERAQHY